jgi:ribosomal protein S18 acetylase RimI-like enzyme
MSGIGTLVNARIHVEKTNWLPLPKLLALEERVTGSYWNGLVSLTPSILNGARLALADDKGLIVGFALYRVSPSDKWDESSSSVKRFLRLCLAWKDGARLSPRTVELLQFGVLPEWRRLGIGRALLQKVRQELDTSGGCIRTVIPESNLQAQLLLRDSGYKAVGVLRNQCRGEDGYLMETRRVSSTGG